MIEEINGRQGRCLWKTKPIVDKIVEYKKKFQEVKFCFVKCMTNKAAHEIVKQAVKGMCPLGWVFSPHSLLYVLNNDDLPAPPTFNLVLVKEIVKSRENYNSHYDLQV